MNRHVSGFSLLELTIVILLIGILAGILFTVLHGPMTQFIQIGQRARLVNIAESTLFNMAREIRLALPNSVRISNGTALEFLRTTDGGRYRLMASAASSFNPCRTALDDTINFSTNKDCFEILGELQNITTPYEHESGDQSDCVQQELLCLVIFNTGQLGANAYNLDNIAAITTLEPTHIIFDNSDRPAFHFPYPSPAQRFQIVDTPVSFVCDTDSDTIRRYARYDLGSTQPVIAADFSTRSVSEDNLLADQIDSCAFHYTAGASTRSGLVTLEITVSDANLGQKVTLLQQIHIDNQP